MRRLNLVRSLGVIVIFVGFFGVAGSQVANTNEVSSNEKTISIDSSFLSKEDGVWLNSDEEGLPTRLVKGIFRARSLKKVNGKRRIYWESCGEKIPEERYLEEAIDWVDIFLRERNRVKEETGVDLAEWCTFSTMANESGFNECTFDFKSRKWAARQKLVEKYQQSYSNETIWQVIHSKTWKKELKKKKSERRKADFGPFQQRRSVRKITRDWFDSVMSKDPGIYLGLREMARRAKIAMKRFKLSEPFQSPWMLWPGWNPYAKRNLQYDKKMKMVSRWLGATKAEVRNGCRARKM